MKTIGIDQSLRTRSSFEQIYMNKIKKIYQHVGKCDYQQKLKDMIYTAVVSNAEVFTENSTNVPMTSTPVKNPIARK